jgi:hypothetical protein
MRIEGSETALGSQPPAKIALKGLFGCKLNVPNSEAFFCNGAIFQLENGSVCHVKKIKPNKSTCAKKIEPICFQNHIWGSLRRYLCTYVSSPLTCFFCRLSFFWKNLLETPLLLWNKNTKVRFFQNALEIFEHRNPCLPWVQKRRLCNNKNVSDIWG